MIYLKHHINKQGDLVIETDAEGQAELRQMHQDACKEERPGIEAFESNNVMHDVFEYLICNSDYSWIRPEEIGALTDAPILGIRTEERPLKEGEDPHGFMHQTGSDGVNTFVEDVERVWWYPNYCLRSPQEDLRDEGRVVFQSSNNI